MTHDPPTPAIEHTGQDVDHGIAMWGTPGCGKTTFLGALSIALMQANDEWKVVGADTASAHQLAEMVSLLTHRRSFPEGTVGIHELRWHLVRSTTRRAGPLWRRRRVPHSVRIALDLVDPAGEVYRHVAGGGRTERTAPNLLDDRIIDNLMDSSGIVFLFDPITEAETGGAFEHLHTVLGLLSQRMLDDPEFTATGRLPHHVAICVTKFDDIRVLHAARHLKLVTEDSSDPHRFPRVVGEDARELFRELCDLSATGNAGLVLDMLEQFFRPDRIRFFVTSAIGFHVGSEHAVFDWDDYQNLVASAENPTRPKIRGTVNPIGVKEPLLWLGERINATARPGVPR